YLSNSEEMKIVAFHTPRPRSFNYKPRFYDKRKEEMEERLKKYADSGEMETTERLRMDIKRNWKIKQDRSRTISSRTFVIYLFVISLLVYFIFFH
ncbi:MAG TPA: hypothetical protein PLV51_08290, partial [Lentimicrobium sp.]|nr:hypothetical protein [Lentimicrobium sp.]